MCDLFLFITDPSIANYADDITLYARNRNINKIKSVVSKQLSQSLLWKFSSNVNKG